MEQQLFPALGLNSTYLTVPDSKMALYAQGYDKQDAPVRLNSGVLGNEAYGVKTSARDLIHFTELNLGRGETGPLMRKALTDTHTGYFSVGPMTQDLIWEQYPYPVELKSLLAGNSNIRFSAPSVWYEAQLSAPDFELYGYHQALVPFAFLGNNREIGRAHV